MMSSSGWVTDTARRRLPAIAGRRVAGLPIETWVLLACAFVLGLAIAAAAFVGVWRTEARHGDSADAARALTAHRLTAATGDLKHVSAKLRAAQAKLAKAHRDLRAGKAALAQTRAELGRSAATVASVRDRAPALTQQASLLISDLAALQGYLAKTPGGAVDQGFVHSQLVYIAGVAARLQKTASGLQQAARG